MRLLLFAAAAPLLLHFAARGAGAEEAALPPPAGHQVDFHREILPILANRCATCHASGRSAGGFSLETRAALLRESDSGQAVIPGDSAGSLLIQLVAGVDPGWVMPKQGDRLTPKQVGLLRAWIDQGVPWDGDVTLRKLTLRAWKPRPVELPSPAEAGSEHPLDRILAPYFKQHGIDATRLVDDRKFARRVYYDVIGLSPTPAELQAFLDDPRDDKRARLVRKLLDDERRYADHWLTFWNDLLRNDYVGTGFIDGGRKQITGWLYDALRTNKPLDQFVRDLIEPAPGAEGFLKGIVWRGKVNASQRPPIQAAQNLSQVFLGINLKCASCHDSFVSQWKLRDCYNLASVFTDKPLELYRCDKATGEFAEPAFFNPELGTLTKGADPARRRRELAVILTGSDNARLRRTVVNRLWARFFGRGLIEPIDVLDNPAWSEDALDWLAADLQAHDDDMKHAMQVMLTSRAYQLPSVGARPDDTKEYVFRGPLAKRLTAEQFLDTIWRITGAGPKKTAKQAPSLAAERPFVRASLVAAGPLMRSLGRPNREQVVTTRPADLTMLQALNLTNGEVLSRALKQGADNLLREHRGWTPDEAARFVYRNFLCRAATASEAELARKVLGAPIKSEGLADLMWLVAMLPEFQLIR